MVGFGLGWKPCLVSGSPKLISITFRKYFLGNLIGLVVEWLENPNNSFQVDLLIDLKQRTQVYAWPLEVSRRVAFTQADYS